MMKNVPDGDENDEAKYDDKDGDGAEICSKQLQEI